VTEKNTSTTLEISEGVKEKESSLVSPSSFDGKPEKRLGKRYVLRTKWNSKITPTSPPPVSHLKRIISKQKLRI